MINYSKNLNVNNNYDVIVLGGGTTGVLAALSAAKEGAKVLIIESQSSLGGTQTNSLVTPIMGARIPGGTAHPSLSFEINELYQEIDNHASDKDTSLTYFFPETMKYVYDKLCLKYGVDISYSAHYTDVEVENDEIKYVVVLEKKGLVAYQAKCYIDTTGDALVALDTKDAIPYPNPQTNVNQAVSLRFEMGYIDLEKTGKFLRENGQPHRTNYPRLSLNNWICPGVNDLIKLAISKGEFTELDASHFQTFTIPGKPDMLCFNCPELNANIDVVDHNFQSKMMSKGYEAVFRMANFMRKYIPGFENAIVTNIATMLGVRQSSKLEGVYTLTTEDVFGYKKFDDGIAASNYPVDVHGFSIKERTYADVPQEERYYEIPFRSLVPAKTKNLLVAGRSASFDFLAQSSARVQHTCRAMGEAVGIGAALMVKNNITCQEIDGVKVRSIMLERGMDVPKR